MAYLNSISPISQVFQTAGSYPVKVLCDDVNEYVCKYSRYKPASALFNEFIAAAFLRIWNLKVPDSGIVQISQDHISIEITNNRIQHRFFDIPCFGSKYVDFGKEIDPSITVLKDDLKLIKRIWRKEDLLAIALFDLWMANEDRHHNNYNLILNTEPEYYFVPIDHERCFNTNSLTDQRGLVVLTEDETLINTELAKLIFHDKKGLQSQIDGVIDNYYLWVSDCQNALENTIDAMPDQWGIVKGDKITLLNSALFNEDWTNECVETFRDYTTRFLLT